MQTLQLIYALSCMLYCVYGGDDAQEAAGTKYPEWPTDFKFSANGVIKGQYCVSVPINQGNENHYLCVNVRRGYINLLVHWIHGRKLY